jgi:signal transduction histidine kinase
MEGADAASRLIEAAVHQDRERIARELHDGVVQQLYGVALSLEALLRRGRGEPAGDRLGDLRVAILDAAEDIRRYVDDLAAEPAEAGLVQQLRRLRSEMTAGTRLEISVDLDPDLDDLPPAVGHEMLQMAREAVSNVVRHAMASRCQVRARCEGGGVSLQVTDDGRGLRMDAPSAGHGLRNLSRRAGALGGAFTVGAAAGGGTWLLVRVPLPTTTVLPAA